MLFRLGLQNGEYKVLLAHLAGFCNLVFLGNFGELLDIQRLQFTYVKLFPFLVQCFLDGDFFIV